MTYFQDNHITIYNKDCRNMSDLAKESVQCVVTSPPYWGLRKYSGEQDLIWGDNHCEHEWLPLANNRGNGDGRSFRRDKAAGIRRGAIPDNSCSLCGAWKGQYGLEPTPEMYVQHTIEILREIRRVLRKDGVVFWNIGDSYNGSGGAGGDYNKGGLKEGQPKYPGRNVASLKPKDLCLIPFRVAIAAQEDGWWVRSIIIWNKPNPMPESVTDRPTESHEYILMLTKSASYYWDADAVREPGVESRPWGKRDNVGQFDGKGYKNKSGNLGIASIDTGNGRNLRSVWTFPTQPFSDWDYDWKSADYEGSDGKPYIASEDCLLHGQYHGWQKRQKELRDGQPNLDLPRITDIPNYLWSEPQSESASILAPDADQTKPSNSHGHTSESTHDHKTSERAEDKTQRSAHIGDIQKTPASSSDCCDQYCAPTAIESSKQTHKSISPIASHDKPSDERASRIPGNSQEHAGSEPHHGKGESRTLGDFSQDGLLSQIPDHNFDIQRQPLATPDTNYTCSCKISQDSHFAVFPEKLPELCIKAATPEVGCCSKCGAPWERITRPSDSYSKLLGKAVCDHSQDDIKGRAQLPTVPRVTREYETLGWQPTCKCNAGKVPSTVLDPFMGSGTTLWVAKVLNRRAVGYETSEEYCQLALERNRQTVMEMQA